MEQKNKVIMVVNILGLGESLGDYTRKENEVAIGVNDIYSFEYVNYFVCVDRPSRFTEERKEAIVNCPATLYTHLNDWCLLRDNVRLINLSTGRGNLAEIDSEKFCYSNNSTFVAAILAYKIGATEINFFGVDMNTHDNLKDNVLKQALNDFEALFKILKSKGIKINTPEISKLNQINK